jgi:predicted esterase
MTDRWLLAGLAALAAGFAAAAARDDTPPPAGPDPAALKAIEARSDRMARDVTELRTQGVQDPYLADVEVYLKAAQWAVRHNELGRPGDAERALAVLDRGLLRASQAARGEAPWLGQTGLSVARAYRSRVDGSVQPYAVTLPADYGKDPRRRWRLDLVLHGRDNSLNEVAFLHRHRGEAPAPAGQDYVQIDIFGRGNNAYRWAGEVDVIEAVDNFLAVERGLRQGGPLVDPARCVLRGFSMGGAGTWHLGLHRPDRWCVLGPGAGFTTTHGFVPGLPEELPAYQEACLRIYDAADYAENAADVPVVAYAGADDPQLRAARTVEDRLKPLGISMTLLVAPGLGHQFPPEWQKKAEAEYAKYVAQGRPEYPRRVRFVTYTLRYPGTDWVQILGLDQHYRQARVDAEQADSGFTLRTENVRAVSLRLPPGAARQALTADVDGQRVEARPYQAANGELHLYLERREGRWAGVLPERLATDRARAPQKVSGLQGPIDDAFMAPFLCVRGTGKPWHEATRRYAEANLERFRAEWSQFLRGELPVKDDVDVGPEDLAGRHLVLFGDPASNSLIEQVLPGLPLRWTKERLSLGGADYDAAGHVPVLIYPSPLAADCYVVLNSGHTFHAADFRGNNALLYPRLGDFAVLKLAAGKDDPLAAEVLQAGLFDDHWRLAPRP